MPLMSACHCLAHEVNGRSKTTDIYEPKRKGGTPLPPPRATEPTPSTRSERISRLIFICVEHATVIALAHGWAGTTLFITNKENVLLFRVVHGWTLLFSAKGMPTFFVHSLAV